jgi:hypothetical protein
LNTLLFEHGNKIPDYGIAFAALIALPVIGGMLTPQRPEYTVVVFATGSVPLFVFHPPPIPIGLWPIYPLIARDDLPVNWHQWFTTLPYVTAFTLVAFGYMAGIYLPLVFLGWAIRCRCINAAQNSRSRC